MSFKAVHYQVNNEAPVRRDFYTIRLMLHKGVLRVGSREEEIREGALVFLDRLAGGSIEGVRGKQRGYWCVFTEGFIGRRLLG